MEQKISIFRIGLMIWMVTVTFILFTNIQTQKQQLHIGQDVVYSCPEQNMLITGEYRAPKSLRNAIYWVKGEDIFTWNMTQTLSSTISAPNCYFIFSDDNMNPVSDRNSDEVIEVKKYMNQKDN